MRRLAFLLLLLPELARADVDVEAFCTHTMKAANAAQCYSREYDFTRSEFCAEVLETSLHAGRITIDAGKLAACERAAVAALPTLDNDGHNLTDLAMHFAACRAVTTGHQAAGAACAGTMECAAGLVCDQLTQQCVRPGKAGDKCSPVIEMTLATTTSTCGDGLFCDLKGPTCRARAGKGGACVLTEQCADGLSCRAGRCAVPRPAKDGESCDTERDCPAGDTCGLGNHCEAKRADGAECIVNRECQHRCVEDHCGPC